MDTTDRRQQILNDLKNASKPLSATTLAKKYAVSRQIIVGDVAIIRAEGELVTATPRGYVLESKDTGYIYQIACIHKTIEEMENELNIMVDNGCKVINVIVEHSVYGQITGELRISSRYDVKQFVNKLVKSEGAMPLSTLTGGVHLHTISCPDSDSFLRVKEELKANNMLYEDD